MPQRPLFVVLFVAMVGVAAWLSLRAPSMPTLAVVAEAPPPTVADAPAPAIAVGGVPAVRDDGAPDPRGIEATGEDPRPAASPPRAAGVHEAPRDAAAAHPLAASALLPAAAPKHRIAARLVVAASGDDDPRAARRSLDATFAIEPEGRADFHWLRVPPGRYTLELRLIGHEPPLCALHDVLVPPPAGGDPRLAAIDLRNAVLVFSLTILAPDGAEWQGVGTALIGARPRHGDWRGELLTGGRSTLLLPAGPLELLVCTPGHRPAAVRVAAHAGVVRLEPWPEVTLRLVDAPPLPRGVTAHAQLVGPADPALEQRWDADGAGGPLAELLQPPSTDRLFVQGVARLPRGDGPQTVALRLQRRRATAPRTNADDNAIRPPAPWSAAVAPVDPALLLTNAAEVAVRAPAASWQAAIDAIALAAASSEADPAAGRTRAR